MVEALYWLLAAELVGLVAFPLAFALFPRLTDRGYSVAKPLGLLLLSWPLWFAGSFHLVPTTPYSLWVALGLLAIASGLYAYRRREEIGAFFRRERHSVLIGEGVFLLFYVAWLLYRSYDPAIDTTEKPMDFAFLNASIITNFFPPEDPWLRGHDLSYYYFGYLMMGNLTELTFIPSRISYNLALALVPAMAGTAAFGLVYNLIRAHGASATRAVAFALVAPVLLLVVSNLEGILEFVRLREWGSASFWDWLGVKDLVPVEASSWRPTDYMWWWRSTRVIDSFSPAGASLDYTITEFPFFSFLLGDLHPHVMSIPFILLFLAFSLNALLSPALLGARWVWEHKGTALVAALLLGALAFVNNWDVVPFAALWAALLLFKALRQEGGAWPRALERVWVPVAVTLSLAVLVYLPYYASMESQVSGIFLVGEVATRPVHLLLIWGLFLAVLLPFLLRQLFQVLSQETDETSVTCPNCGLENLAEARFCAECGTALAARQVWPRAAFVLVIILAPFFTWAVWQLGWSTLGFGAKDPLSVVVDRFLNTLPLVLLLFVALYSLVRRAEGGASPAMVFVLAVLSLGLLLILGPEFFRVDDLFHNRMNTVFKLYYQAWVLLAIASAFGLYFLSLAKLPTRGISRWAMRGWWGLAVALLLASLYYPVEAAFTKSGQFRGETTLDGLAYVARSNPEEYAAIRWLQENGTRGEGVLETVGRDYNPAYSRMSGSTGLPTILGWPGHEHQWRGTTKPLDGRAEDVREIYTTQDTARAMELIRKYDIRYVVVGPRERAEYGSQGLAKFSQMGDVVFPREGVTIYRVRE